MQCIDMVLENQALMSGRKYNFTIHCATLKEMMLLINMHLLEYLTEFMVIQLRY